MPIQSQLKPFQSTRDQPTRASNKGPVKGRFPSTSILRKPSVDAVRCCDPLRRRKSVTWAASPVLNAIRWIESREDLRRAKRQAQGNYRPPHVSEDDHSEISVVEAPIQKEPSNPSSLSIEPPSSHQAPTLQTSQSSPGFSASSAPEDDLNYLAQRRVQSPPAAEFVTSLKRQGAIKLQNRTEYHMQIVLPKRDPGSYLGEKISRPNRTPKCQSPADAVPLEQHGAIQEENGPI